MLFLVIFRYGLNVKIMSVLRMMSRLVVSLSV